MICPVDETHGELESYEIDGGRVFYYCLHEDEAGNECYYSETR